MPKPRRKLSTRDDLTGRLFGRLAVRGRGVPISKAEPTWACHCGGCGRDVTIRLTSLAAGADHCGDCARRMNGERARATRMWERRTPKPPRRRSTRSRPDFLAARERVRALSAEGKSSAEIGAVVGLTPGRVRQILIATR